MERMKQGTVPANILDRGRERMLQKTALVAMTGLHRIEVVQDLIRRGFKVDVIPLDNINVQEKIEAMVFNRGKKRFGMLNYRLIVSDLSWELKAGNGLYPGWGYKLADFFYKDHGTEDKVFMMIGQGNAVKDLPLAGVDVRGVTAKDLKNQLNNADADIERSLNADWQRFIKSNFKLPRAPKSEELNGQQEKTIAARSPAVSQSVRPEKEGDALAGDQTKKASPSGVRLKILLISPYLNRKTKALRSALGLAQHEVQIGREFDAHQMWDMVIGVATKSVPRNYHGTFMTMRGLAIEDVLDKVATMSQERLISNKAMTVPGGIDLDGGKLLMNVDKDGQGISMRVDPTMLARFRRGDFVGLVFNIVRISPIADLKGILSR